VERFSFLAVNIFLSNLRSAEVFFFPLQWEYMRIMLPDRFVLWDTEYTAWKGSQERNWSGKGEYREIVQIGAIALEGPALVEESAFSVFIQPVKNPELSEYFIELTGITQNDILSSGVSFGEALSRFESWVSESPCYSFGGDESVLKENCELFGLPFPHLTYRDVRAVFEEGGVQAKRYTSGTITEAFGRKSSHRAHNALNDVRTIKEGLRLLAESEERRVSLPPFLSAEEGDAPHRGSRPVS
jgi:inhibitor of KinA sporulation pathway (predicted exonuclease)